MKKAKERIIFNNYYGWISEDDIKTELVECAEMDEAEITDDMIMDEMYRLEELCWEDEQNNLESFFNDGNWLVVGTLGLWDGRHDGGKVCNSFREISRAWDDCNYIKLWDENGHFYIECSHHDGTNCFEVKRLTNKGYELFDNWNYGNYGNDKTEREIHKMLWNCNLYTALPHYCHKVYGCKKHECV